MHSEQFLKLAEDLTSSPHSAAPRTVVGRAYYGLYNILADFLRPYVRIQKEAKGHKDVSEALKQCTRTDVVKIGSFLEDLRSARNDADYRMELQDIDVMDNAIGWVEDARKATEDAVKIFGGAAGIEVLQLVKTDWQVYQKKIAAGAPEEKL